MPRKALLRQTILNHTDPAEPQTGATWSSLEGPVRVGRVSRVTEAELRLPSEAAAPHFSLLLLLEGQGHFYMPDAQESKQGRYLEFLPGHCYLSCSYQPFRCEDYVPANISFRAIFCTFRWPCVAWSKVVHPPAMLPPRCWPTAMAMPGLPAWRWRPPSAALPAA